jgi:hypothetical protein
MSSELKAFISFGQTDSVTLVELLLSPCHTQWLRG